MPKVKPLALPSREGRASQQDQADLQVVCTGRRRICALLNTPSPCASTAICHIQDMRSRLNNWFQKPRISQPEIDPDNLQNIETLRLQRLSFKDLDSDPTGLYVEGIAITARGYQKSPLKEKIEDVLSEVVNLVERLEADRQFAEEALQKEKRRRKVLVNKIDAIALWKLNEHPAIIQREHDACSRDIAELQWQLKRENQKVDEVQEKLLQSELLNRKLQEDTEFARNQIPIVKENNERQEDFLRLLEIAQAEADNVQASTKEDLLQIEMELEKEETAATKERVAHQQRHEEILDELDDRLKELNRLKVLKKNMLIGIEKTKEAVIFKEKKQTEFLDRLPEIANVEKAEEDKISHLNLELEKEVKKNEQLRDKRNSIQRESEIKISTWEAELVITKAHLYLRNEALEALLKENKEYEQKIDDCQTKICKSEKQVKQLHEERKQMLQKINDNDEHWEKAKQELTEVTEQHRIIKAELDKQENLVIKEDQEATIIIEGLRKELAHLMSTVEKLKGKLAELSLELKKYDDCSELANRGLQKEFDESYSATQALEAIVKRMKELIENLEKTQREHEDALADLEKDIKLNRDQLKVARDLHGAILWKIKNGINRYNVLMNKTKEYQGSSREMEKDIEAIPKVIAELEKDLDVVDFKNKSAARTMSTLQSDINNWQLRTDLLKRRSLAHLRDRRQLMEETEGFLEVARAENERLAIEYQDLKKMLLEARQESVSALRVKNRVHKKCSYYTELSLLQKRMHKVLVKYLEQRSLRFLVDLEECQTVARKTSQKISIAQGKFSEEIQLISVFLQSIRESSTTTKNAEKNKQTSPDATEVNE
ncbi:coiled-coil domain-containing protein 178 isoform X1 [Poecilia latipinna]|uniref:Coiled-coil domain containing 178 n=1 Tax=Poecilia latipinna TaxID=48699 RepID=A0A3B3U3W2_9TELE|nr:PREDICTED: coiled-coil domain-containing protein 178 isoform X1 [Poecilia latipinna]